MMVSDMVAMTKEELAAKLNGRQYPTRFTEAEILQAKAEDLVVILGIDRSERFMVIWGAVNDVIIADDGDRALFTTTGLLINKCDDDECPYFLERVDGARSVTVFWDRDDYTCVFETDIPHSTFDILDGDEKCCRGIVFSLADVS